MFHELNTTETYKPEAPSETQGSQIPWIKIKVNESRKIIQKLRAIKNTIQPLISINVFYFIS